MERWRFSCFFWGLAGFSVFERFSSFLGFVFGCFLVGREGFGFLFSSFGGDFSWFLIQRQDKVDSPQ